MHEGVEPTTSGHSGPTFYPLNYYTVCFWNAETTRFPPLRDRRTEWYPYHSLPNCPRSRGSSRGNAAFVKVWHITHPDACTRPFYSFLPCEQLSVRPLNSFPDQHFPVWHHPVTVLLSGRTHRDRSIKRFFSTSVWRAFPYVKKVCIERG